MNRSGGPWIQVQDEAPSSRAARGVGMREARAARHSRRAPYTHRYSVFTYRKIICR